MNKVDLTPKFIAKGYSISTDKSLLDVAAIHQYLANESYWAGGLSMQKLQSSIQNSLCFGIYHENNLCAFARVITDKATFAYVCDVFVMNAYRGQNLSKWLMQNIKEHTELKNLRRWLLATADAHGLYEQFGFTTIKMPDRWMEIYTPNQTIALPQE